MDVTPTCPPAPIPARLLDRRDLAALFGVRTETIASWQKRGALPPAITLGKKSYWAPASIAALLAARG
jgi:predicted DNA-binding transcriptional regulator AlpA